MAVSATWIGRILDVWLVLYSAILMTSSYLSPCVAAVTLFRDNTNNAVSRLSPHKSANRVLTQSLKGTRCTYEGPLNISSISSL